MTNTLLATDRLQSPLLMRQAERPTGISYGPYGYRSPRANTPVSGFTGQPCEQYLSWYLLGNGHRAYNPVIMRFHSPDGLSPFSRGGLNAYAYCHGNPINFHDRNGRVKININQNAVGPITSLVSNHVPEVVSSVITNSVNIAGASQPALTTVVYAAADWINGTNNVDLTDPETIAITSFSALAGISAILEPTGYSTGFVTSLLNLGPIILGGLDTADNIGTSNQAATLQNTGPTVTDGGEMGDAGHEHPLLTINAGQQSFNTTYTKMKNKITHLESENAELRQRVNRLRNDNRDSNQP